MSVSQSMWASLAQVYLNVDVESHYYTIRLQTA